jgi:hypothetical protein
MKRLSWFAVVSACLLLSPQPACAAWRPLTPDEAAAVAQHRRERRKYIAVGTGVVLAMGLALSAINDREKRRKRAAQLPKGSLDPFKDAER